MFGGNPTWVCCRNDGPKEEAVSKIKISPKLAHKFHEGHKTVHDQPGKTGEGVQVTKDTGTPPPFNKLFRLNQFCRCISV